MPTIQLVFGTDEEEFQNNSDMLYEYSELWHLSNNFDKTKIMIFSTRQVQRLNINLGGHKMDICTDLEYLGVIFRRKRWIHQTKKHNAEQARKAMHELLSEFRILIFQLICSRIDHVISPIALYGCEIWGFENSQIIENLHNDFLRQITNLRKSNPIYVTRRIGTTPSTS